MNIKTRGANLKKQNIDRIMQELSAVSVGDLAKRIGISKNALVRAAGGFPVIPGTAAMIEAALSQMGTAKLPNDP